MQLRWRVLCLVKGGESWTRSSKPMDPEVALDEEGTGLGFRHANLASRLLLEEKEMTTISPDEST